MGFFKRSSLNFKKFFCKIRIFCKYAQIKYIFFVMYDYKLKAEKVAKES